jgi:hypothetical protein
MTFYVEFHMLIIILAITYGQFLRNSIKLTYVVKAVSFAHIFNRETYVLRTSVNLIDRRKTLSVTYCP